MTEKKKRQVGEVIKVADPVEVVRPNGDRINVTGGSYVLDVPGVHDVGGTPETAE